MVSLLDTWEEDALASATWACLVDTLDSVGL